MLRNCRSFNMLVGDRIAQLQVGRLRFSCLDSLVGSGRSVLSRGARELCWYAALETDFLAVAVPGARRLLHCVLLAVYWKENFAFALLERDVPSTLRLDGLCDWPGFQRRFILRRRGRYRVVLRGLLGFPGCKLLALFLLSLLGNAGRY